MRSVLYFALKNCVFFRQLCEKLTVHFFFSMCTAKNHTTFDPFPHFIFDENLHIVIILTVADI